MGKCLAIVSISYQAVIYQLFFSIVLERRYSSRITYAGTALIALLLSGIGLFAIAQNDTWMLVFKSAFSVVFFLTYVYVIYRGTVKKRMLAILTLYAALSVSEICIAQIVSFITKSALEINLESAGMKIGYILGFPIYSVVIFGLLAAWKQYHDAEWKSWQWSQLWLCVLFFLSQFIILQEIFFFVIGGGIISTINIFGLMLSGIADLILFYAFRSQDKKIKVERRLRELRYLYEREELYFQEIEERQKEMEKIRHDFKNQISVIGYLAERDDEESRKTAREMAERLQTELGN